MLLLSVQSRLGPLGTEALWNSKLRFTDSITFDFLASMTQNKQFFCLRFVPGGIVAERYSATKADTFVLNLSLRIRTDRLVLQISQRQAESS